MTAFSNELNAPMITTNLSPQRVLDSLPKSRDQAIRLQHLAEALNLNQSQTTRLSEYMTEFVRVGMAAQKQGRYWRKPGTGMLVGTLRGTRSGHAFVLPDDGRERESGDLYIGARSMGPALNGDTVIARVIGHTKRGREARIEAVLHRASPTIVGRFIKLNQQNLVAPMDERFLYEISVAPADTLGAKDGDIVNVEITRPPIAGRPPWARVIEVLGAEDTPGIDVEIIIRKHHLPHVFPATALAEAEAIPDAITDEQVKGRADLRGELTVTIDGESARDFDDAVSLEALPSGRWLLGVHIADVSHYVREGSALDHEALRRGTSVYFPERAIPMLPERLSNGVCSLNPRVDRLTMSALMELDRSGRLVDYRLTPSVIHSRERMTYTAVNEIIIDPKGETARRYAHIEELILRMHGLALALIKRREDRGAIDFDLPEAELLFNDEGQIGGIARSERNIAHRIIEEFMLLANETVARHLEGLGVPALFRIHEEPNIEKVEEFAEIAASFGHKFSMHGPVPQRGFQRLAREIRDQPEERMLSYLMLRSMQRARYSVDNAGHFGLAMKSYTHFTSPIRRYPDLIVHRIVREVLEGGRRGGDDWTEVDLGSRRALKRVTWAVLDDEREQTLRGALEPIADHSSERERAADAAERELMDWRKAEFMADRVGDVFDGVITSVKDYGFYVELNEVFVEGLVHVSTLDGVYEYQERKHRLVGGRDGRVFRLGDQVSVRVDRVDRARHLIDFSIA
ncbi:MAG TPA: ribonuclease R [Blastocatellia bacterium]|nr:ribonuclease R [Blastocatellia bacterium]